MMAKEKDGWKTVDSLRGRLLAERAASRTARDEANLLGNKLVELETELKAEMKSRNKAEKKLRLLLKKLESLKISYALDESDHHSCLEKHSSTDDLIPSSRIISIKF